MRWRLRGGGLVTSTFIATFPLRRGVLRFGAGVLLAEPLVSGALGWTAGPSRNVERAAVTGKPGASSQRSACLAGSGLKVSVRCAAGPCDQVQGKSLKFQQLCNRWHGYHLLARCKEGPAQTRRTLS